MPTGSLVARSDSVVAVRLLEGECATATAVLLDVAEHPLDLRPDVRRPVRPRRRHLASRQRLWGSVRSGSAVCRIGVPHSDVSAVPLLRVPSAFAADQRPKAGVHLGTRVSLLDHGESSRLRVRTPHVPEVALPTEIAEPLEDAFAVRTPGAG